MTIFQLFLLLLASGIFYIFYKQLLSGNHPKRGVDFEAKNANEQIGGINRPDKTFSTPQPQIEVSRIDQLIGMIDEAVEKEDFEEASKAVGSALIVDENNIEVLKRAGFVAMTTNNLSEAKEHYMKLIELDSSDDMAHATLASVLHKLDENELAEKHYEKAIRLDDEYAVHHYNYANMLYNLDRQKEALVGYKVAYKLDSELKEAKEMIDKLEGSVNE